MSKESNILEKELEKGDHPDRLISSSIVAEETIDQCEADPYVLLDQGREALKEKKYNEAVNLLSDAIETILEDPLYSDNEVHGNLAPFYFEYGHALLLRAENSTQFFNFGHDSSTTNIQEKLPNANSNIVDNKSECSDLGVDVPDEQLTWEILELARMCYQLHLADLETNQIIPFKKENIHEISSNHINAVRDASLVHLYLASILLAEEQFNLSIEEVKKGLAIVEQYNLCQSHKIPFIILLGDTYQANQQHSEALSTYKEALDILTKQLTSSDSSKILPLNVIEDLQQQKENVLLEIQEIENNIKKGIYVKPNQHIHDLLISLTTNPSVLDMGIYIESNASNTTAQPACEEVSNQPHGQENTASLPFHDFGILKGRKKLQVESNVNTQSHNNKRAKVKNID